MLVQNLAIAFKCYSAIGNSFDLKKMMYEVLKVFVSESYCTYGSYCIENKELSYFGKIDKFSASNYDEYKKEINLIEEKDRITIIIRLEYGSIFLISKNLETDYGFFTSMFESLIKKLNISIDSCMNVQKLKELNQAKDDFLANISHELKTPLNSINLISSVMKKNKDNSLNERNLKNIEIINSSGNYLLNLINDILDISRLESGRTTVSYEKVNLKETLGEIQNIFLPQLEEKGIDFIFNFDESIKEIYSDNNKIKQIIKNLLSNSVKFVNKGYIKLSVKDEDKNIMISVEDNGVGIAKEKLEHIFDRFKQADSSTTRKYGGTGLGLSICKELLKLLNGSIFVKSKENIGSTFYVTLPKNLEELQHLEDLDVMKNYKKEESPELKKDILVFNSNAITFFSYVMHLNKFFNVKQINQLDQLNNIDIEKFERIIVDKSSIDHTIFNTLNENFNKKLFLIDSDQSITETINKLKKDIL